MRGTAGADLIYGFDPNGPEANINSITATRVATGLSQPNTSGHLGCLKDCGLVESRQAGRFVYYRLADPRVETILREVEELLARVGDRIYACTRYNVAEGER